MTEPVTTGGGFAALFSLENIEVLLGALTGAWVYLLSLHNVPAERRLLLFLVSFVVGVLGSGFVAQFLDWATPDNVHPGEPIGAVIAAVIAVRLLVFAGTVATDPVAFIKKMRGGKDDE
jgi:hypothetical protein